MRVQRKAEVEMAKQIAADAQAHHDAYLDEIKKQHTKHMEGIAPAILNLKRNTGDTPKVVAPGIVVLPGDYYTDDDNPIGISQTELDTQYVKV